MSAIDETLLDEIRVGDRGKRQAYVRQCQEHNSIAVNYCAFNATGNTGANDAYVSSKPKTVLRKRVDLSQEHNAFDARLWQRRERHNASSSRMIEFRTLHGCNQYNQSNKPGYVPMPKDMEEYEIRCYWKFEALDRINDAKKAGLV